MFFLYNNIQELSPLTGAVHSWKDTVLVTVLCILLHPLQMLLVTFKTPGVVFDLWHNIALLQAEVENLRLLLLLHLVTIITAKVTTREKRSANVLQNMFMRCLVVYKRAPLPHDLIFFTAVSSSVFAVVVIVQEQRGLLLVAPLQHLGLGLAVWWGIFVLQVSRFTVEGVGNEAQVPFLILFKTDRHYTWEWVRGGNRGWLWVHSWSLIH